MTSIASCDRGANNFVPMSDYSAALTAIDNRFHEIREILESRDDLACGTLFEKARESLTTNLKRIVQPIENEEYNALLRMRNEMEQVDDSDVEDDTTDEEIDDNEQENKENQQQFDPDELIDSDAILRVTKLRAEIRMASIQLAIYRDSVTTKALFLADQQIRHTRGEVDDTPSDDSDQSNVPVTQLRENFATVTKAETETSQQLTDCLTQLTQNLNSLDLEAPAQLLQETLETVETVQQEPLSQTERAIRSRNNAGMQFSNKIIEDPVDRLNHFLG